ncbi:hypothetical protein [Methanocella paludicola]
MHYAFSLTAAHARGSPFITVITIITTFENSLPRVIKMAEERKGEMTVEEAGRKGGHKGGEKVKEKYGPEFYSKIGHKGGQRVKELIKEGEKVEREKK